MEKERKPVFVLSREGKRVENWQEVERRKPVFVLSGKRGTKWKYLNTYYGLRKLLSSLWLNEMLRVIVASEPDP